MSNDNYFEGGCSGETGIGGCGRGGSGRCFNLSSQSMIHAGGGLGFGSGIYGSTVKLEIFQE